MLEGYATIVILLLCAFFIALGIVDIIEEAAVDAVCEAYGWPKGDYTLYDGSRCVQVLECSIDDVIDGNCFPVENAE